MALPDLTPYLFDQAPVPMCLLASDGTIQRVNPAYLTLARRDEQEVIGRRCCDVLTADACDTPTCPLAQARRGEKTFGWTGDVGVRGETNSCFTSGYPLRNEQGGLLGVFLTIEDLQAVRPGAEDETEEIGKRVAQLEREHERERKIRASVLSSAPYPIFWKDKDLVYLGCNAAMATLCGLGSRRDIIGLTDHELGWGREEADSFRALDREVLNSGEPALNIEEEVKLPGGKTITYLTSKTPLRDPHGEIIGVVGATVDITEFKRTSEALGQVQAALDDASDAVLVTNADGQVSYVNLAFGILFKQTADSISEEGLGSLFAEPEAASAILHEMKHLEKWEGEIEMRKRGGEVFPGRLRATPLVSDELEFYGTMFLVTDMTSSRSLQQQLLQAQKMESIGQLAASIAHEINTPTQYVSDNVRFLQDAMTDILGLLEKIQEMSKAPSTDGNVQPPPLTAQTIEEALEEADAEFLKEEIPQALNQGLDGLQRIATIVRAMKEFSHPGTKEMQVTDLNKALASTITVTTHHWKYVATVETEFDPALPHIPCLAGELNQAVLNLIVNAVDAITEAKETDKTREGVIRVKTHHAPPWVEIRISDTGTGIPPDVQERVFEPFFTTKEVGKGSGQGLAITYAAVVDKHGGQLELETDEGVGTTFILKIPDGSALPREEAA